MKRPNLLILLFLLLLSPVVFTGCQAPTVSARTQAARSLETVAVAVNGAMNTYGVLYRAGQVDAATRARVTRQYELYQVSANAALTLLGTMQAPAPEEVQRLANDVIALIATLQKSNP